LGLCDCELRYTGYRNAFSQRALHTRDIAMQSKKYKNNIFSEVEIEFVDQLRENVIDFRWRSGTATVRAERSILLIEVSFVPDRPRRIIRSAANLIKKLSGRSATFTLSRHGPEARTAR
jgi:hypothetical protein